MKARNVFVFFAIAAVILLWIDPLFPVYATSFLSPEGINTIPPDELYRLILESESGQDTHEDDADAECGQLEQETFEFVLDIAPPAPKFGWHDGGKGSKSK